MHKKLVLLLILVQVLMINTVAQDQSQNPVKLFDLIEGNAMQSASITDMPSGQLSVNLNENLFGDLEFIEGERIQIPVSPQKEQDYEVIRTLEYFKGTRSVIARKTDGSDGFLILTSGNGNVTGKIYDIGLNLELDLNHDPLTGSSILSEADHSGYVACSVDSDHIHLPDPSSFQSFLSSSNSTVSTEALEATVDEVITIDLLIVYTPAARDWAQNQSSFGSIQNLIAQAMSLSQLALDNSEVDIELRLVDSRQINYDELNDGRSSSERLQLITAKPDFNPWEDDGIPSDELLEIHDFRDNAGADLVAGIANIDDTGGIAWRLGSVAGVPELGFSLNRVQQTGNTFTLVHEIGHNLGNVHDRDAQRSAAPAGEVGGVFENSAGFFWEDSNGNGFQTVMSQLPQGQFQTVSHFSNPQVQFNGNATGTNSPTGMGPANAAMSMNLTKTPVSFYRQSITDPPQRTVSTDFIQVDINREDNIVVPFDIGNVSGTGSQPLVYDIDFEFTNSTLNSASPVISLASSNSQIEMQTKMPDLTNAEYSPTSVFANTTALNTSVFSTSFGSLEGFSTGDHAARAGWRTFSDSELFNISTAAPSDGTTHLRLQRNTSSNFIRLQSPFFGPQPFGAYEFSADIAIRPNSSGTFDRYDIVFRDDRTGDFSAAIVFIDNPQQFGVSRLIFVQTLNESGDVVISSNGAQFVSNQYRQVQVIYNPDDEVIQYRYGGTLIAETPYTTGNRMDSFLIVSQNDVEGAILDVDNVEVNRTFQPFSWLDIQQQGGVVNPGETEAVNLDFRSFGKEEGTFEANMIIRTNDPQNERTVVPVQLNVNTTVSTIDDPEVPRSIKLEQNFPNPFNPSTVINFELNRTANVTLEVYNVVGQKVATLINNEARSAGRHSVQFDGRSLSSGVYIYRLITPEQSLTKSMTLIK